MSFIPKLYFSPGAVSLVTHIALEELGNPYVLEPVLIKENQQRSERYLGIHPLGRLPALEILPGEVLTETPALLTYIADQAPGLRLLPTEPLPKARANEWMSLMASTLHIAFLSAYRPDRFTADSSAQAALRSDGRSRFLSLLQYVERRLPPETFALGRDYTLVDAYLCVIFLWARRIELPLEALPRYARLASAVLARPAVRRALEQEGFGHLFQRA